MKTEAIIYRTWEEGGEDLEDCCSSFCVIRLSSQHCFAARRRFVPTGSIREKGGSGNLSLVFSVKWGFSHSLRIVLFVHNDFIGFSEILSLFLSLCLFKLMM